MKTKAFLLIILALVADQLPGLAKVKSKIQTDMTIITCVA